MHFSQILSLALSLAAAEATYQGFNYGSTFSDNSAKAYSDFKSEFTTAQNLVGTSGFTSARLYTMIQAGTTDTVIEALQAAVDTKTSLLLGMWASGDTFANELTALKSAISSFPDLASSIAGIGVGSEDLYRNSPIGIEAKAGIGANPSTVVDYINEVKSAISGTSWSGVSIGHVDTWTAWVNGSNSAVIDACDWLGVDAYPYFQDTMTNGIDQGLSLFDTAMDNTKGVASGKDVWITETGWPVSGPVSGDAVASLANAKTYWDQVGCPNFGSVNTWWYTLQDAAPTTPSPSFGVVGSTLSDTPLYDLSCKNVTTSSSSSASSTKTSAASGSSESSSATATGSSTVTAAGVSPSAPGGPAVYSNGTVAGGSTIVTTISGQATTLVSAAAATGTGASGATGTDSGSGSATGSSSAGTASATSYQGSASNLGSSAFGIFGAVAAAVLLL